MFGLRLLCRGIQAGVLYAPDGSVVDIQKAGSTFLKDCPSDEDFAGET